MNKLVKIEGKDNILNALNEFADVFPGLTSRVLSYEDYADKLDKYADVYRADNESEVFGLVVFYANDTETNEGYISLIGIKKRYERMGLGTYLLNACISQMRAKDMRAVKLEVDDNNIHAVEFYKRNGFKKCGSTERNSTYMMREI